MGPPGQFEMLFVQAGWWWRNHYRACVVIYVLLDQTQQCLLCISVIFNCHINMARLVATICAATSYGHWMVPCYDLYSNDPEDDGYGFLTKAFDLAHYTPVYVDKRWVSTRWGYYVHVEKISNCDVEGWVSVLDLAFPPWWTDLGVGSECCTNQMTICLTYLVHCHSWWLWKTTKHGALHMETSDVHSFNCTTNHYL